jgi:hypothetical protein
MMLCAGELSHSELSEFILGLEWPLEPSRLLWVECPDTAELIAFEGPGLASLISRSYSGRVFSRSGELRWRGIGRPAGASGPIDRLVFLGETPPGGAASVLLDNSDELRGLDVHEQVVALWGTLDQSSSSLRNEWVDSRIPRRLAYPWTAPETAPPALALRQQLWRDARGAVQFIRFMELVEWKAGGHDAP